MGPRESEPLAGRETVWPCGIYPRARDEIAGGGREKRHYPARSLMLAVLIVCVPLW